MSNKISIAIVILLALGIFGWLVNYGWTYRYGSPETYEVIENKVLSVGYQNEELSLQEADVFAQLWQNIPGIEVNLNHQITEKPWSTGLTPVVKVQAFHDGENIYFKMVWEDDHADNLKLVDTFVDGCAVAIPIDADAPVRSIMMGFSSPVNIWQWQANADMRFWEKKIGSEDVYNDLVYPFEGEETLSVSNPELQSAVTDLLSQRAGSITQKKSQIVQGRGFWRNGSWHVIFKRSLTTNDKQLDSQLSGGSNRSVSFAVWDGDQADRGSRKSISEWVDLQIQSQQSSKKNTDQPVSGTAHDDIVHKVSWLEKISSFSLVSTAHAATVASTPANIAQKPRVIDIQAKRFQYTPNRISLEKGELVTLRMESLDVTHGLYIDGYEINIKARPGLIGKATFVADKPGRFTFRCSETCGEFHPYMIGFLEVTPNSRFNAFVGATGVTFVIILGLVLCKGKQKNGVETNV